MSTDACHQLLTLKFNIFSGFCSVVQILVIHYCL